MYDDSLDIIEKLNALNPVYRQNVLSEVLDYFYEKVEVEEE